MKRKTEIPSLDDVLNEFMAEHECPTADALEALATRYPQFRRELVDFAAAWAEQRALPPARALEPEQEKALINRAMSHVENVTFSRDRHAQGPHESSAPMASLTAEAKQKNYTPQKFAKACGLDIALLTKLNNRQIRPGTIPPRLISHIGKLLDRTAAAIAEYLRGPPKAAATMAFLARGKPQTPSQQSFGDAVRASSLSAAEKARWLDEAARREES
jgi:hypothetical protein